MANTFTPLQDRQDETRKRKRRELLANVIVVAAIVGVFGAVISLFALYGTRVTTVAKNEPAGEILRAEFNTGLLDNHTTVETTTGTFLVSGTFQAVKGRPLQIETRLSGHRYLCDRVTSDCRLLDQ